MKQETLEEAFYKTYFGNKISFNSDIGKAFELGAECQQERISKLRDELFNQLPIGKINSFDLIKIIKNHIKKLDEL